MSTRRFHLLILAGCCLLSGCRAGKGEYPAARLQGAVTVDGKRVEQGTIQFVPQHLESGPITQAVIQNGAYVAEAVPLGKMRVVIHAKKKTGRLITGYSTPYPEIINIVPAKYRQGIELDVSGDNPELDFKLVSK